MTRHETSHPQIPFGWPLRPTLQLAGPALADDSEIFTGAGNVVSSQRPNILFIVDSSGSMDTDVVTQVPYNPLTTYAGSCSADRVYFLSGSNTSNPARCRDSDSVPLAAFKCNAASAAFLTSGYYLADRAAQLRAQGNNTRWRSISITNSNTNYVECRADAGVHGNGVNLANLWATDTVAGWTANPAQQITWNANGANGSYVFYSANYLNWYYNASTITQTRLQIVQQVATQTSATLAQAAASMWG